MGICPMWVHGRLRHQGTQAPNTYEYSPTLKLVGKRSANFLQIQFRFNSDSVQIQFRFSSDLLKRSLCPFGGGCYKVMLTEKQYTWNRR